MKNYDLEKLIRLCEIELKKGTEVQTVLCYLKALNVTIIDVLKIMRRAKNIDLGEAKRLVTSNKCWDEEGENIVEFTDQMIQTLKQNYNLKISPDTLEITFDLNE